MLNPQMKPRIEKGHLSLRLNILHSMLNFFRLPIPISDRVPNAGSLILAK